MAERGILASMLLWLARFLVRVDNKMCGQRWKTKKVRPPMYYEACAKKCGRYTVGGVCWTCHGSKNHGADKQHPDWWPPCDPCRACGAEALTVLCPTCDTEIYAEVDITIDPFRNLRARAES